MRNYTHLFDPGNFDSDPQKNTESHKGDRRDGKVYQYNDQIILAINVALATGRPLLVSGPSGCGKSTLAKHVAMVQNWRYYEYVITSHTEYRDLLWEFDAIRRLADAQAKQLNPEFKTYIDPSVLWWAFSPSTAKTRGIAEETLNKKDINKLEDPGLRKKQSLVQHGSKAVVLLDEIDKADPDMPNNLLVALGSWTFTVTESNFNVELDDKENPPLIIITTNNERRLPDAFVRRCITLNLKAHTTTELETIAKAHFPNENTELLKDVAKYMEEIVSSLEKTKNKPSAAEYIDALYALRTLEPKDKEHWKAMLDFALRKSIDE